MCWKYLLLVCGLSFKFLNSLWKNNVPLIPPNVSVLSFQICFSTPSMAWDYKDILLFLLQALTLMLKSLIHSRMIFVWGWLKSMSDNQLPQPHPSDSLSFLQLSFRTSSANITFFGEPLHSAVPTPLVHLGVNTKLPELLWDTLGDPEGKPPTPHPAPLQSGFPSKSSWLS